jgi:hypothetical protein
MQPTSSAGVAAGRAPGAVADGARAAPPARGLPAGTPASQPGSLPTLDEQLERARRQKALFHEYVARHKASGGGGRAALACRCEHGCVLRQPRGASSAARWIPWAPFPPSALAGAVASCPGRAAPQRCSLGSTRIDVSLQVMEAVNDAVRALFRCERLPDEPLAFLGQRLLEAQALIKPGGGCTAGGDAVAEGGEG